MGLEPELRQVRLMWEEGEGAGASFTEGKNNQRLVERRQAWPKDFTSKGTCSFQPFSTVGRLGGELRIAFVIVAVQQR